MPARYLIAATVVLCSLCSAQVPTWIQGKPAVSPSGRTAAMAFDSSRNRIVLFGGWRSVYLDDTWEHDGSTWIQVKTAVAPSARTGHAMVYDSSRKRVVLFGGNGAGGYLSDTWEYDGAIWTRSATTTSPPARSIHSMAFDAARKRVVMFGGYRNANVADTWEWDGTGWTQAKPSRSPTARQGHAMAYDSSRDRVVLFGGITANTNSYSGETWEWSGSDWIMASPSVPPSPRAYHAMVEDAALGRVVMFGGQAVGNSQQNDTWTWGGVEWTRISTAVSPPARRLHAMAYSSTTRRVLVFGGYNGQIFLDDSWELKDLAPNARLESFGKGWASSSTLPKITSGSTPKLGSVFPLTIRGFLPRPQFGQLVFGRSDTQWGLISLPLPLDLIGMGGCTLYVSLDGLFAIALDSTGATTLNLPVPSATSLLGATVYGQAVAPDPNANLTGAATTNAFKAVVGYEP